MASVIVRIGWVSDEGQEDKPVDAKLLETVLVPQLDTEIKLSVPSFRDLGFKDLAPCTFALERPDLALVADLVAGIVGDGFPNRHAISRSTRMS
jgi:hypothetical protein